MHKKTSTAPFDSKPSILGAKAFAAISAVEGLKLTEAGRKRIESDAPIEQRRAEVLRFYTNRKQPK